MHTASLRPPKGRNMSVRGENGQQGSTWAHFCLRVAIRYRESAERACLSSPWQQRTQRLRSRVRAAQVPPPLSSEGWGPRAHRVRHVPSRCMAKQRGVLPPTPVPCLWPRRASPYGDCACPAARANTNVIPSAGPLPRIQDKLLEKLQELVSTLKGGAEGGGANVPASSLGLCLCPDSRCPPDRPHPTLHS